MDHRIYLPLLLVVFSTVITLCYVFVLFRRVSRLKIGNKKVEEIQKYIQDGATTFLVREYKLSIRYRRAFGGAWLYPCFKGCGRYRLASRNLLYRRRLFLRACRLDRYVNRYQSKCKNGYQSTGRRYVRRS